MGLDLMIRKILRGDVQPLHPETPKAFHKNEDFPRCVLLDDTLTRCHFIPSSRGDRTHTGEELYNHIVGWIKTTMMNEGYRCGIMCIDQEELVPPEKSAARKDRDAGKKDSPYDSDFAITDEGLVFIGSVPTDVPERINMGRLMASPRRMRRHLWEYIHEKLKKEYVPADCCIIMDWHMDGPLMRYPGGSCTMPQHRHEFGEADLGMIYWSSFFRDLPTAIHSCDTDVIATSMFYIGTSGLKRAPLVWVPKSGEHVRLNTLYAALRNAGWEPEVFLLACVWLGTDYVKKAVTCHRVATVDVLSFFLAGIKSPACDMAMRCLYGSRGHNCALYIFRMVHGRGEYSYQRQDKSITLTTEETVNLYKTVTFNTCYWMRNWNNVDTAQVNGTLCAQPVVHTPFKTVAASASEEKTADFIKLVAVNESTLANRRQRLSTQWVKQELATAADFLYDVVKEERDEKRRKQNEPV